VLEQAQQIHGTALLPHTDADARTLGAEAPDDGGEEAGADALADADRSVSAAPSASAAMSAPGGVEACDDRLGVAE
jgi:hypothetical protein